MMLGADTAK